MPIVVPLNSELPSYTQTVDLDGERWIMRVSWRPRLFAWYCDLYTRNGDPVLLGRPILAGRQLNFSVLDGPPGALYGVGEDPTRTTLGTACRLLYYTRDEIQALAPEPQFVPAAVILP